MINVTKLSPCLSVTLFIFLLNIHFIFSIEVQSVQTEDEFYDIVQQKENNLIFFTKTNCRECNLAKEVVSNIAKNFEGENCSFLSISCDKSSLSHSICKVYQILKFPSLSFMSEGLAVYDYNGHFNEEKIRNFMQKYSVPKTIKIDSKEELSKLLIEHPTLIVGVFSQSSEDAKENFRKAAANMLYDQIFVEINLNQENQEILTEYNLTPNSVAIFKYSPTSSSQSIEIYNGPLSRKKLTNWVSENSPTLIYSTKRDHDMEKLKETKLPYLTVYFKYSEKSDENIQSFIDLQSAAKIFRSRVAFAYSSLSDEAEELASLHRIGLDPSSLPFMTIFNPFTKDVYVSKEAVNLESINRFVDDFLIGKISPIRVKQPLPSDNTQLVKVVVYDNFKEIVQDKEKDVAVLFYLPKESCRHCVEFLEMFEQAAKIIDEKYHKPHLVFAKMDMHANEFAPTSFRIRNFPSLYFFARDNKYKETIFKGKRTIDNVVNWLIQSVSESKSSSETEIVNADI